MLNTLSRVSRFVDILPDVRYGLRGADARERLRRADLSGWPILALDCPLWAEDRGFFSAGAAAWTGGRAGICRRQPRASSAKSR